eukprot:4769257-Amphidinium_carterae.1
MLLRAGGKTKGMCIYYALKGARNTKNTTTNDWKPLKNSLSGWYLEGFWGDHHVRRAAQSRVVRPARTQLWKSTPARGCQANEFE